MVAVLFEAKIWNLLLSLPKNQPDEKELVMVDPCGARLCRL
jgi:hypothetical protein